MTEQSYVAVKGSLHSSDSSVFGLTPEEFNALSKRYPDSNKEVINGVLIKGSPLKVINSLGELGYRVVCSSGETEIVWTLKRDILGENSGRNSIDSGDTLIVTVFQHGIVITNHPSGKLGNNIAMMSISSDDKSSVISLSSKTPEDESASQKNSSGSKTSDQQEEVQLTEESPRSSEDIDNNEKETKADVDETEKEKKTKAEGDETEIEKETKAEGDEKKEKKIQRLGTSPEDFENYASYKGPKIFIRNPESIPNIKEGTPVILNTNVTSPQNPLPVPGLSFTGRYSNMSHCSSSCHEATNASVRQTLDEMDFERGIWSAAVYGDLLSVQKHLDKGTDPNIEDKSGYTALHYAARAGYSEICAVLIKSGALVNKRTRAGGATPLHRAALAGHPETCRTLLAFGACAEVKDVDGRNPLHRAVEGGHREVVDIFVERMPALAFEKDNCGRSPLDYAEEKGALSHLFPTRL